MADEEQKKPPEQVNLKHRFNYIGGPYAYKNSSKKGRRLDPENLTELVLMARPGQASRVSIALPEEDIRAGTFPQHNTVVQVSEAEEDEINIEEEDYESSLELIPSRTLDPYVYLTDVSNLKKAGFEKRICSMTKARLNRIRFQFSHLSDFAFNQMLDIPRPDKRDFVVWYKTITKNNQAIIVYPSQKEKRINFVQTVQYNDEQVVLGIKQCIFTDGEPLVINETCVDKFKNLRQIAHLGGKGDSKAFNSVERFDDGSVSWIVSQDDLTGAAVLRPDGKIVFVEKKLNEATKLAARNLGGEKYQAGNWTGEFSIDDCYPTESAVHEAFKTKVRNQIGQIVDSSSIPGLEPIFWI